MSVFVTLFGSADEKLLEAVQSGDSYKVAGALKKNPDINIKDEAGNTPLILALKSGRTDIAELLINSGANVNLSDRHESTPLLWATYAGYANVAHLLISKGANITRKNKDAENPLHWACIKGDADLVCLMIEKGADVNDKDKNGYTPLLFAAQEQRLATVRMLIDNGASLEDAAADGNTALRAVIKNGNKLIEGMITKAIEQKKNPAQQPSQQETLKAAIEKEGLDPAQSEHWLPVGDAAIDCVFASVDSPKLLSNVFNFAAQQFTLTTKNLLTGEKTESTGKLEDFPNQEFTLQAYEMLKKLSKNPPPFEIKKVAAAVSAAS